MKRSIEFARSFIRLYRKLPPNAKDKVNETVESLIISIESARVSPGVGLKRLKKDIWEARVNIDLRISFEMTGSLIKFLVVGGHDEICKFLKNI